jgi:exopolyphosphatase/guanosine-5'-triphosphate,3'-diphosphate pyrophosphatase
VTAPDRTNTPVITAAGIDVGSNSFRLLVAEVEAEKLTPLAKELTTVRLGQYLSTSGSLSTEAMERGLIALKRYNSILGRFQPRYIRACGTAALRTAANSGDFLKRAREILSVPIEIISGEEEAILGLTGAAAFIKAPVCLPQLLVDVGGGSTEFVITAPRIRAQAHEFDRASAVASLELGVVALTERFLAPTVPTTEEVERMSVHIRTQIAAALQRQSIAGTDQPPLLVVGTGGTATAMAALDLGLTRYDADKVQNHELTRQRLDRLWLRLAALPVLERNRLPGLESGRGEILLAGIKIFQILLEELGGEAMQISDAGLLEGLVLSSIEKGTPLAAS